VKPTLILASSSPRRRELLRALGLEFEVMVTDVDEALLRSESPVAAVERLARAKADAAAAALGPRPCLVLAADTLVAISGQVLGKPSSRTEAGSMLRRLAGHRHDVHTAVALLDTDTARHAAAVVTSSVRMAAMSDEEIDWYVGTGEPLDKAGAYAVQGLGAVYVESIDGNYTNVVGLPLPAVRRLIAELGYDWRDFRAS
jgi:septum formation protein